ncbi:hypothetical protein ABTF80_21780, partial [Acinetobacter baumannii]
MRLLEVSKDDPVLLREELGNLGEILGETQTDSELAIELATQCSPDDIVAVCC